MQRQLTAPCAAAIHHEMNAPASTIVTLPGGGGLPKVVATASDGACIEAYVHGAHVASWRPAGNDERLYVSPKSPFRSGTPIRGGIPVCFPQFADQGPLPMHGFVRDVAWTPLRAGRTNDGAAQICMRIADSPATRSVWPHAFTCELTATARAGELTVELVIVNTGGTPFGMTAALHTYLRVNDVRKTVLDGLTGARYRDKRLRQDDLVEAQAAIALDEPLDRVYHTVPTALCVREPDRRLVVHATGSTDTVVWNPGPPSGPGPHDMPDDGYLSMLCVEAAIARAPLTVAAGATHVLAQRLVAQE